MPTTDNPSTPLKRLSQEECLDLLRAAAVGRLGFVTAQGVQIIPVGYRLGPDRRLFIATQAYGIVGQLAESGARVAFEVDYHGTNLRVGWSVLAHGVLSRLDAEGRAAHAVLDRPLDPWPGYRDAQPVQLTLERLSGRSVQRLE